MRDAADLARRGRERRIASRECAHHHQGGAGYQYTYAPLPGHLTVLSIVRHVVEPSGMVNPSSRARQANRTISPLTIRLDSEAPPESPGARAGRPAASPGREAWRS